MLLDSGSCLNLVGESFVKDVLGIKSEDILPSEIMIKGFVGVLFLRLEKSNLI